MEDIQKNSRLATRFEAKYLKKLLEVNLSLQKEQNSTSPKELETLKNRVYELDKFIKKLFEDNTRGKITDERYVTLSNGYETEQKQLKEKLEICETKIRQRQETAKNA